VGCVRSTRADNCGIDSPAGHIDGLRHGVQHLLRKQPRCPRRRWVPLITRGTPQRVVSTAY